MNHKRVCQLVFKGIRIPLRCNRLPWVSFEMEGRKKEPENTKNLKRVRSYWLMGTSSQPDRRNNFWCSTTQEDYSYQCCIIQNSQKMRFLMFSSQRNDKCLR